ASEQTLTQRSALCTTREGFMIYAWGDSSSPEVLGAALLRARCVRAMHLDMNAGHSGMELYNVLAPDEPRLEVGKKEPYRYEGTLADFPGYILRARKAVTAMGMVLPRYIRPDPRDFFYLTLKPGVETASLGGEHAPVFSTADLPHAGWPPAMTRSLTPQVRILKIDASRAAPAPGPSEGPEVVLAELRGTLPEAKLEDSTLYSQHRHFAVGVAPPGADEWLRGPLLASVPDAEAALGVDGDGLLVYAECDDKAPHALATQLEQAGVTGAIALPKGTRVGLRFHEGLLALDGSTRFKEAPLLLRWVASSTPAVETLFQDNTPIPYARWAALQDQRVRYFRTNEPTSRAPQSALSGAP
ncbi:MAG TPA: hypothetical protein VI299_20795, partial [Polyangiales bacterium]